MKKIYSTLFVLCAAMMMQSSAYQYAAGGITYTNLGGLQYRILLTIYADCTGGTPPATDSINIVSGCAPNFNVGANLISSTNIPDTVCHNSLTTCQGGIAPGIQKLQYAATVVLPNSCADWIFSFRGNYRNCAISTVFSPCTKGFYVEAHLNNLATPNNSVQYSNDAVIFTCKNQTVCFNTGAPDPDADSLVYSLISPRSASVNNVVYLSPYSYSSPLASSPALSLNSSTGQICFTATKPVVTVMTLLVQEYRGGVVIGQTARDIEIIVSNCAQPAPFQTLIPSTFAYPGNDTIKVCGAIKLDFYIAAGDSDPSDSLRMTWNRGNLPTGATFNISGKPPKGNFDWAITVAGTYYFSVTVYAINCNGQDSSTVNYVLITNSSPTATITDSINNCNNSTATVHPAGGNGNYQYLWLPSILTTQTIPISSSGIYSVRVTDARGCSGTASITISFNYNLSLSFTKTSCMQPTGTASANVSGGVLPYTYHWNNGQTTSTATSLSAGTYTVTVMDAINCMLVGSVVVPQPGPSLSMISASFVTCPGDNDGKISITVNGNAPFTYLWSNGETTSTATGLSAGTYKVTITDSVGCTYSGFSLGITQPTWSLSPASGQTGCGSKSGIASVNPTGSHSPYTCLWSNGQTTTSVSGLSNGIYTVTVTDSKSCVTTTSFVINNDSGPALTFSQANVSCSGGNNGSATVSASGINSLYTFMWSNGSTQSHIANLAAQIYSVTVTDAKGCTTIGSVSLTAIQGLTASISGTTAICSGQPATLTATGGATYSWSTGQTTNTISVLTAGTYSVTVSNGSGCTGTASATVTLNHLTLNFKRSYIICEAGSVQLTASGGTSYSWIPSFGLGCTSCPNPVANPNSTTNYTVTVGSGACSDTAIVSVYVASSPLPPVITVGTGDTLFSTHYSSYQWFFNGSFIPSATNPFYVASNCGVYSVLITDSNGCSSVSAGIDVCNDVNETSVGGGIIIYPNPTSDHFTISGLQFDVGQITIELFNIIGEKVYSAPSLLGRGAEREVIDISSLPNGIYIVQLTEGNNSYHCKLIKN